MKCEIVRERPNGLEREIWEIEFTTTELSREAQSLVDTPRLRLIYYERSTLDIIFSEWKRTALYKYPLTNERGRDWKILDRSEVPLPENVVAEARRKFKIAIASLGVE